MKTFFFLEKKHTFSISFSNFSNFQTFLVFLPKNLIIRAEKTVLQNITIDTHSKANLQPLSILKKKIFSKKPIYFIEKTLNFERFEKSYCFSRILRQIWYNLVKKIFMFRNVNEHPVCNWQTSGKKNVENGPLSWRFCFHILKNMAQNNNYYPNIKWTD